MNPLQRIPFAYRQSFLGQADLDGEFCVFVAQGIYIYLPIDGTDIPDVYIEGLYAIVSHDKALIEAFLRNYGYSKLALHQMLASLGDRPHISPRSPNEEEQSFLIKLTGTFLFNHGSDVATRH